LATAAAAGGADFRISRQRAFGAFRIASAFREKIAQMRVAEGVSGQRAAPLQGGVGITSTYLAPFSGVGFNNPTLTDFP
jgi:hypothetical protein